ncbi:hypothetical protein FN976_14450 [Caenimonas sedimenti]|uniref:Twin-arginine translocation pathway signal protein n=1 Tax=Caenimonas sedimenti TaxID=2596921 RepID=A0A562ZQ86_9BURK|nr:hypothetical protein [Caenimonas sedimenti]TWO70750.1 hypothetical protein FN976_14450 [Caenimonas sedimenti]
MQRRSLLKLGAASAALLLVGGGALAVFQPGLVDGRLSSGARKVFLALGGAMLDGLLPPADRARALEALVQRVDALVAGLPPHAQAELSQLLALLESSPGRRWLAGLEADWPQASATELQAALQSMRFSGLSLRQQAYHALHDIVNGAYFSEQATWVALGYPGPAAI